MSYRFRKEWIREPADPEFNIPTIYRKRISDRRWYYDHYPYNNENPPLTRQERLEQYQKWLDAEIAIDWSTHKGKFPKSRKPPL